MLNIQFTQPTLAVFRHSQSDLSFEVLQIATFLYSSGKIFHNLGPKYDKDSNPYRTVFIQRAAKSEVFLRSYL